MKKLYFALAALVMGCTTMNAVDYYMIGGFNNWTLADPSCKMTETTTAGVYTVTIADLYGGFKINDGTWDNSEVNFGANSTSDILKVGTPYEYVVGAKNNISLETNQHVKDAVVSLDINAATITVTGTTYIKEAPLFIFGTFNNWDSNAATNTPMTKIGEGVYEKKAINFTIPELATEGEYKLFTEGYAQEWGQGDFTTLIEEGSLTAELVLKGGNAKYAISGTYDVKFNTTTCEITFTKTAGVNDITVDNNAVKVYYNLQGVEVANPSNGLYIVKQGSKVQKEYVK